MIACVPFHITFPVVDVCTVTWEPKFIGQGSLAPCTTLLTKTLALRKWAIIMPVDIRPLYSGADRWLTVFSTRGFRLTQTRFTWSVWSKYNNDVRGLHGIMDSLHNMELEAYHRIHRFFGTYDASIFLSFPSNRMIYLLCIQEINLRMLSKRRIKTFAKAGYTSDLQVKLVLFFPLSGQATTNKRVRKRLMNTLFLQCYVQA